MSLVGLQYENYHNFVVVLKVQSAFARMHKQLHCMSTIMLIMCDRAQCIELVGLPAACRQPTKVQIAIESSLVRMLL